MGMLSERLEREFDQAEQVQFDYRLAELKAVVRLMEADLVSQGSLHDADKYEGANPMSWLKDDTSHYLGVMEPIKAIDYPGNWFFDEQTPDSLNNAILHFEKNEGSFKADKIRKVAQKFSRERF